MVPKKIISDCSDCMLAKNCVPSGLSEKDLHRFTDIVSTNIQYKTGDVLYQQNDKTPYLFVVKAGSFKTQTTTTNGAEHVNNFFLAGDIIGLDSAFSGIALSTANALEDGMACKIKYKQLAALRKQLPSLSDLAVSFYANALAAANQIQNNLTIQCASSRLAAFILFYNQRLNKHRLQRADIHLSMSRQDIASHLGLAVETISRSFSKLIETGAISKNGHHIEILDIEKLEQEANLPARQLND
ncbi:MAG TPA: Crp/Fnr family transcriptional regulator [Cycloclasticus sp.]|nr:Crp/Fnr family transcriptional regulator [Cycloclasticus sp.]